MSETTRLPLAARVLLSRVIDLDRFDTEIEFARIERTYDEEEGAK